MRWPVVVTAGFVSLTALAANQRGGPPPRAPQTVAVSVTCPGPQGQRAAVQPWEVRLHLGDTLQWNLVEPVLSDTIIIALKDSRRAWPFEGPDHPQGRQSARARGARATGSYAYNITLRCPVPGGPPRFIVIDPDFIIDE